MKTEGEVIYYEDKSYSILKLSKKKIHLLRGSSLLWIPQNSGGALNPLLSCEKQVLLPLEKKIDVFRYCINFRASEFTRRSLFVNVRL